MALNPGLNASLDEKFVFQTSDRRTGKRLPEDRPFAGQHSYSGADIKAIVTVPGSRQKITSKQSGTLNAVLADVLEEARGLQRNRSAGE